MLYFPRGLSNPEPPGPSEITISVIVEGANEDRISIYTEDGTLYQELEFASGSTSDLALLNVLDDGSERVYRFVSHVQKDADGNDYEIIIPVDMDTTYVEVWSAIPIVISNFSGFTYRTINQTTVTSHILSLSANVTANSMSASITRNYSFDGGNGRVVLINQNPIDFTKRTKVKVSGSYKMVSGSGFNLAIFKKPPSTMSNLTGSFNSTCAVFDDHTYPWDIIKYKGCSADFANEIDISGISGSGYIGFAHVSTNNNSNPTGTQTVTVNRIEIS